MSSSFTVFAHYTGTIAITPEASHKKYLRKHFSLPFIQLETFVDAEQNFQVISSMRALMTEESNDADSDSFLLDDDSR